MILDQFGGQNEQEIAKTVMQKGKENLMRKKVTKKPVQRGSDGLRTANTSPSRAHLGLILESLGGHFL